MNIKAKEIDIGYYTSNYKNEKRLMRKISAIRNEEGNLVWEGVGRWYHYDAEEFYCINTYKNFNAHGIDVMFDY